MGYVATQPGDDADSLAAMKIAMRGEGFDFLTKESKARLFPVAFGSRRCRGNETRLHSHLGEAFAGDWAINKCRHLTFGMRFNWITDCYALKFILSYDGSNPAILRLQMRLMCWDMDIYHRNGEWLGDPDYWSRLARDICYDPLLKHYTELAYRYKKQYPAPSSLPMQDCNMPYYRGPRVKSPPKQDASANAIISAMLIDECNGMQSLATYPVKFGQYNN